MDIPRIFPVISHLALFGASTSTRWWTHVLQAALPEAALPAAASPWSFKRRAMPVPWWMRWSENGTIHEWVNGDIIYIYVYTHDMNTYVYIYIHRTIINILIYNTCVKISYVYEYH